MRRTAALTFIFTILLMTASIYAIEINDTEHTIGTYAIVTGLRVNVRSYGKISAYNQLFQVERGEIVKIHGTCGEFFRATVAGFYGVYISQDFVRITQTQGTVTASFAWVYDLPGEEGGSAFTTLPVGDSVTVTSRFASWYGIEYNGQTAFVHQFCIEIPYYASNLPPARVAGGLANVLVETAKNYLGTRYVWGGSSPAGFDCSGFMVYLFTPYGINLNRVSRDQARNGFHVERDELLPADLVFFGSGNHISHVGMYIGGGEFIHSSSDWSGGVIISSLSGCQFSSRNFVTARRVI